MSEFTFATVQRAFAEAMARPPIAADEARALAAVAEAEGKPCVLPDELIARLEAEACSVLGEVEPMHSMKERRAEREERAYGNVLYDYDPERGRVVFAEDDWRPRATRTPSGWTVAGGWLDEPVPPLPTGGVPNAGGVRPRCDLSERELAEENPGRVVTRWSITEWHLDRRDMRKAQGRGWCSRLGATWMQSRRSTRKAWRTAVANHDRAMRTTDAAWAAERAELVRAKGEGT